MGFICPLQLVGCFLTHHFALKKQQPTTRLTQVYTSLGTCMCHVTSCQHYHKCVQRPLDKSTMD